MFDIAWSELAVIGAVALVVIGPKDLPKVMRTMGQWSRKMRLLASEFQRHIDDMVRQSELDEIRKKAEEAAAPFKADMEGMGDFAKDSESVFPTNVMHPPDFLSAGGSAATTHAAAPAADPDQPELPLGGAAPIAPRPPEPAPPESASPQSAESGSSMADRGETRL